MRKDKKDFTLDVVSGIDEEIVDHHLAKRYKLWQRRGRRRPVALISLVAALVCVSLIAGVFMTMLPDILPGEEQPTGMAETTDLPGDVIKQVPVYLGMTVTNDLQPAADVKANAPVPQMDELSASSTLPPYTFSFLSEEEVPGSEPETDPETGAEPATDTETGSETEQETEMIIFGQTYYALKNEDIYIHVHLENPDGFEIISFTLNGVKYSSYMFERGSDMENLILKYNVGDVDGLQEYTIDAIKYIDGESIKDVRMEGDRTVKVFVEDGNQALRLETDVEYTKMTVTPVWDEAFEGERAIMTLALYEGEVLLQELVPTATEIRDLPAGKRLVLVATYVEDGITKTVRHIFDTPAYSEGLYIVNGVIMGVGNCTDPVLYVNNPIGDRAFFDNNTIHEIYMGPGVTYIGDYAFASKGTENRTLKKVVCSENTNVIGQYAFQGCKSLVELELSPNLRKIPNHAFHICTHLETVIIPEGVTEIGTQAFENNYFLANLYIPRSVIAIGTNAFGLFFAADSSSLREVDYGGTMQQWQSIKGTSSAFEPGVIIHCTDGDLTTQ
ncbi:MAG: leucine-rich repeat domain-containing protein [Ruminococcaceae bacterium]|nr:leucine-rich repeat domain-containing protein [Oscillospiraceae bacterium]